MRVLLLNPPYKTNFIRSARSTWPSISGSNWYPIFLAYTAGWLEKHGHSIRLIDALVDNTEKTELYKVVKDFKPELLILYISEQSLESDINIGIKIKKITECQIVLVGPWCSNEPEKILKSNGAVDCIVPREFDDVVLDLANGKQKKSIKGLIYRDGNRVVKNRERGFLTPAQLDKFPFVVKVYKEHLLLDKYHQASLLHPFVDLFTGRGCIWGKCTFCLWPHTIHRGAPPYRARSMQNVIEEIKFIKKELPDVREIFIQDDTFPAARAREFAKLIIKNRLKIIWSCYARANVDYKTLKLMKRSGCRYLHVGYESGNNQILKNICKGLDTKTMEEFTRNTKKVGLKVHGDFILGLPGETESTIKETIKWAKSLNIEGYQFLIPQPQKQTPLYVWLQCNGFLNSEGEINYSFLNHGELNRWRFQAMKSIYLSPKYFFENITNISSFADFYRLARTAFFVIPNIMRH